VDDRPDETQDQAEAGETRDLAAAGDAGGPGTDAEPELSPREKRYEIIATVLLALAALATAWSGYQASLWDGIQSSNYTQASAARTQASLKHTEANQFRLADLSVFENYIDATIDGNDAVADFYRQRFRDDFVPAFEAWTALDPINNPDSPPSPFAMPEYRIPQEDEANELTARAEQKFQDGEDANTISDTYTASTLFFAAALFFAAISERFAYRRARLALLGLAGVGLVGGVAIIVTQPVTTG
jgi:hypothetical protein